MTKLPYIEGLRGIAALMVVLGHLSLAFYPAILSGSFSQIHTHYAIEFLVMSSPLNLIINGNLAICIFFILSSFVLSYKFFESPCYELILSAAIRRYFRLAIPVFFSILLAYIFMRLSLFEHAQ